MKNENFQCTKLGFKIVNLNFENVKSKLKNTKEGSNKMLENIFVRRAL